MHRYRRTLISYGVRLNSTVAEASTLPKKRRGVTLHWGQVVIPSREEILKIPKIQSYSPDLSYLEKAPWTIAGKLAKSKSQPKDLSSLPIDVSSLTERRRVERLDREQKAARLSTPRSTSQRKAEPLGTVAITQKSIEIRLARDAKKAHNLNETIRAVQDNAVKLTSLSPVLNSPGPLPLASSVGYSSVELLDEELSPSALKRRKERRLRESSSSQDRRAFRRNEGQRLGSNVSVESDSTEFEASTVDLDSARPADFEAASPTVHAPEFNGPSSIPDTIDVFNNFGVQTANGPWKHGQRSFTVSQSPSYSLDPNMIDSFAGGDYSRYTSLSSTSNSTPSNAVTAVRTAELAISYQRDYAIPQRKHAIEIVKNLVGANLVQDTKEGQATA